MFPKYWAMCVRKNSFKVVMYDRYDLQQDLRNLYTWKKSQFSKMYEMAETLFS